MGLQYIFFFPAKHVGGVQTLFCRTANFLANKSPNSVAILDYPDGYLSQNANNNVIKLSYSDNRKNILEYDSILITQASNYLMINQKLDVSDNMRIFLWYLHPDNFTPVFPLCVAYQRRSIAMLRLLHKTLLKKELAHFSSFIHLLMEHNAIGFMDNSCLKTCSEMLNVQIESKYITPLFIRSKTEVDTANCWLQERELHSDNATNVTWLGRLESSFKYYAIKKLIDDLDMLGGNGKIKLNVIGSGEAKDKLVSLCGNKKNLRVCFLGDMSLKEIKNFLVHQTDILFAMGTSALHGAEYGVPTVCLDAAYSGLNDSYKYRWLHETMGYSLGYIIRGDNLPVENHMTMQEVINHYKNRDRDISNQSFGFYNNYTEISNDIFMAFDKTTLTNKMCKERDVFKLFSIKQKILKVMRF